MKKPLLLGYISILITVGANLAILPFAYLFLSRPQIGLWFNYITLYSLLLLLDFGITTATARAFSHAWSKQISDPETGKTRPDHAQYAALFRSCQIIYNKIALIGLLAAAFIATPYLFLIAGEPSDYRDIWMSWPIYCAGVFLALRQLYLVPALRGMDRIENVYSANIAGKLTQAGVSMLLMAAGVGIAAVSLGFLASTLVSRFLLGRFFRHHIRNVHKDIAWRGRLEGDEAIRENIAPKVFKQGVISLANFFQDKAALFYISAIAGLDASSRYGLTVQIIGLVSALSNVYYNSVQAKLIDQHVHGNMGRVRTYLRNATLIQSGMIVAGGLALFVLGRWFLHLVGMSGSIVDNLGLGVIVAYSMLFNFQLICANYLLIRDDYSMMWPYVISALVFVVSVGCMAMFRPMSYLDIVLIQLGVLLIYNAWKWPSKVWNAVRAGG